jgi:hypothetical protein
MRTVIHAFAIIASILAAQIALGQAPQEVQTINLFPQPPQPNLQKFNLDFPGGGPKALVAAIEKATGKPLNAIVPSQEQEVQLPSMKLTNVTVPELFEALRNASTKQEILPNGLVFNSAYDFQTQGRGADAVWYFRCQRPQAEPLTCRFFQLAEFLDNFTIEDITTAIQTGWQLLGVKSTPRLKFHPETKLLIAVGQREQLKTIEDVLAELRIATAKKATDAAAEKPAPARTPKKDGASNH